MLQTFREKRPENVSLMQECDKVVTYWLLHPKSPFRSLPPARSQSQEVRDAADTSWTRCWTGGAASLQCSVG